MNVEDFGPCESCGGDYQSGYCMSCYEKAKQKIKELKKVIEDLEFCNGELSNSLRESGNKAEAELAEANEKTKSLTEKALTEHTALIDKLLAAEHKDHVEVREREEQAVIDLCEEALNRLLTVTNTQCLPARKGQEALEAIRNWRKA